MTDIEVGGPVGSGSLQEAAFDQPVPSDIEVQSSPTEATANFDDHSSQGSTPSQPSQSAVLKHSTSDVSRLVTTSAPVHDLTPPSSNASISLEDGQTTSSSKDATAPSLSKTVKDLTAIRSDSQSPHSASSSQGIAGTKRTATGEEKPKPSIELGRPTTSDRMDLGHVRTTSAISNASSSNVIEISSQLRTRLKYAMLKVQNGWQTRSLDELESIASASPRSTAGFQSIHDRPAYKSPQRRANPQLERTWSDSSSSESARSDVQHQAPNPAGFARPVLPADAYQMRSLAPPADIKPGMRRRPTPNDGVALSGMAASPLFSGHSPAVRPSPSQRTPSQNAAMEADAVETLLFMASPNNSGYHPPSQTSQESSLRSTLIAQTSPLRTQFSQTSVTSPKKVAFSGYDKPEPFRTREAQIENELNTMPDDSDDDLRPLASSNINGFLSEGRR